MGLVLPARICLNFRERVVCEWLYPPQFLAFDIQHDLLAWPNAGSTTFNRNQLLGTSRIGCGECIKRHGRSRTGRPRAAGAQQKKDNEQRCVPLSGDGSCSGPHNVSSRALENLTDVSFGCWYRESQLLLGSA